MSKRTELLSDLARQALAQYDADIKAGGEPIYPLWAKELQDVLAANEQLAAALRNVTDVLDSFGNLPDGMMAPAPWRDSMAERKITAARAALATAENSRMSPEEARDAKIAELMVKNADHTKALIASGDMTTIREVGDCVTNYLAFAYDDLNKLVTGELTFAQVRDKVIENDAEVQAIKQVERAEQVRKEQEQWARIERRAWDRQFGVLL